MVEMVETPLKSHADIVSHFMSRGEPVRVEDAIRALGINYRPVAMPDGYSGKIERDGDNFTIFVNTTESPVRQRFTAAHELSHFLLHRDLLVHSHADRLFDPDPATNPPAPFTRQHEYQANNMAANILMPRSRVEHRAMQGRSLAQLARDFDVSPVSMRIRLQALGLPVND